MPRRCAGLRLRAYRDLLQLSESRRGGLTRQVELGARPDILLAENDQNVVRRRALVVRAEGDFQAAANALSLYYRDAEGNPVQVGPERLPGGAEALSGVAVAARQNFEQRRPDLQVLLARIDQLVARSGYRERRAAIAAFNAGSPVLKKGLALTPVKFGIAFNVVHLNQAGALVHVYSDGSILVNHGGTEMGQGLNTKVAQMVAHTLGVAPGRVRCTATDTSKVANTSATAASTGSDLNGQAAADAARQIRARLVQHLGQRHGVAPEDIAFADDAVRVGGQTLRFQLRARHTVHGMMIAVHSVYEQIIVAGQGPARGEPADRRPLLGDARHPLHCQGG